MDKKVLHHWWKRIRPVKVWYLAALVIVSGSISVLALRANNVRMAELRQQVYTADEKGGNVEAALQDLRRHVYGHMNTDLSGNSGVYPPIQLKYTYQRLQEAEHSRVQKENSQIYTDAQTYCETQNSTDVSGRNRIPCIEAYVANRGIKTQAIPDALYKFDFISPTWSPDLAGFSLIITGLLSILLVARIAAGQILPKLAK